MESNDYATCNSCYILFLYDSSAISKNKKERLFRESLQKGQKVITIGGLHGKITDVKDTSVIVEISNDVKVEVEKSAVTLEITPDVKK